MTFIIFSSRHMASWSRYFFRLTSLFIVKRPYSDNNTYLSKMQVFVETSKHLQKMQVFVEMKKYL